MLYNLYFSPTRSSRAVAYGVSEALAPALGQEITNISWTPPAGRKAPLPVFTAEDVLVLAFPVYAGRIPELIEPLVRALHGEGTPAVVLSIYGNRDYDDALLEACDLLTEGGFAVVSAGAFIGEHSYTRKVGANRPSLADLEIAAALAGRTAEKLRAGDRSAVTVKGNRPYKKREPAPDIRPHTTNDCNGCGICVSRCPLGVIDAADPSRVSEGCLRCAACVKACPRAAKFFASARILAFKTFLETTCKAPKAPVLFL